MDIVQRFEEASKKILDDAQAKMTAIPEETKQKLESLKDEYNRIIKDFMDGVPDLEIEDVVFSKTMVVDIFDGQDKCVSGEMYYCRNGDTLNMTVKAPQGALTYPISLPVTRDKKLKVRIIVTEVE